MLPYYVLLPSLMKCALVCNMLLIKIACPLKQFGRLNSNIFEVGHSIYVIACMSDRCQRVLCMTIDNELEVIKGCSQLFQKGISEIDAFFCCTGL